MPNGSVNPADPCISSSLPVPISFVAGPTAMISGQDTVCPGGQALLPVSFTGQGPFTFVYALNGQAQLPIQAPQANFQIASNNILQTQTFTLISVKDANCPGSVGGTAIVTVAPKVSADLKVVQPFA